VIRSDHTVTHPGTAHRQPIAAAAILADGHASGRFSWQVALSDAEFVAALQAVPAIKTGRPKSKKATDSTTAE